MTNKIQPVLSESDSYCDKRHDRMTDELYGCYGQSFLAKPAGQRLLAGFSEYLAPLAEILPRTWAAMQDFIDQAWLIELKSKREEGLKPLAIYPIVPTPNGYCTFGLYEGEYPSLFSEEVDLERFQNKVKNLPDFLQRLVFNYKNITICFASEDYDMPDVEILAEIPYASDSINDVVKGKRRKELTAMFGDLEDMRLVAFGKNPDKWVVFFVDSEKGDQSLYVSPDEKFTEIRKFVNPQHTFDLLFEHYITYKDRKFDFYSHTVAI